MSTRPVMKLPLYSWVHSLCVSLRCFFRSCKFPVQEQLIAGTLKSKNTNSHFTFNIWQLVRRFIHKIVPVHSMKSYSECGGTSPLIPNVGPRRNSQLRAPAAFFLTKESPLPTEQQTVEAPELLKVADNRKISCHAKSRTTILLVFTPYSGHCTEWAIAALFPLFNWPRGIRDHPLTECWF